MLPTIILTIFLSLITLAMNQSTPNKTVKNSLLLLLMISLIPMNSLLHYNHKLTMSLPPLISLSTENINISITLDTPSLLFLPITLLITLSVMEFSTWYMASDPNSNKFINYLVMFLLMMIIIITANNMYQMFIGWEGVGVMSFVLIGWWNGRSDANTAALQAIIYNRIGDIGLITVSAWSMTLSSINMQELLTQHETTYIIPALGLLMSAIGKSAQLGLHPWLPSAMEGPTPVSALLHSSTMVVAGVFLLIRLHPILCNNNVMSACLILGATTTMLTAATANTQMDIKKIIALSTTSQLGLMMTMIGLNQPTLAFLHMITHSFFKALLFLCSGSIIHNLNNEQDVRKMGGMKKTFPMTSSLLTIANFSLMGMPFLSGFYSKDTIIETMLNSYTNSWALMMTLIATAMSASYSTKILLFSLTEYPRTTHSTNKETKNTINSLSRLMMMSILTGTMTKMSTLQISTPTMPKIIKLMALCATIIGMILSKDNNLMTNYSKPQTPNTLNTLLNQLIFFNIPHRTNTMNTLLFSQKTSTELMDLWSLETWGPKGLVQTLIPMISLSTQQKNTIKNYLTIFTVTTIIWTLFLLT